MATKPPSAAQLAARARFAEMARSGVLNRKRQIAAKKRAVNPIEEEDVDKLRNEFEIYFAGEQKIAKRNGYRINKADEWIRFVDAARLKEQKKLKRNPAKKTVSQKISQLVHEGYPQRQAVAVALNEQRKGKVKRNPARAKSKSSTVYRVEYSKDCKNWETWMTVMYLDMAKAIAQRLADDPFHKNHYVRIESATEIL
jgi:hypothetical protein